MIPCGEQERKREKANHKTVKPMGLLTNNAARKAEIKNVQGGSNMTGTICVKTSHSLSRSYLNHLVHRISVGKNNRIKEWQILGKLDMNMALVQNYIQGFGISGVELSGIAIGEVYIITGTGMRN
jgi:hypothetical protein